MAKSIQYKTGNSISHDNNAVNSSTNSPSKTFPVYADDGTFCSRKHCSSFSK